MTVPADGEPLYTLCVVTKAGATLKIPHVAFADWLDFLASREKTPANGMLGVKGMHFELKASSYAGAYLVPEERNTLQERYAELLDAQQQYLAMQMAAGGFSDPGTDAESASS